MYKGKGALSVKIIKPSWERIPTGSGIRVSREGTVLLEFANGFGDRNYAWDKKGTIGLSAFECGELLEAVEAREEQTYFHDPSMGGRSQGAISKSLKVTPAPQQGSWFFSLAIRGPSQAQYSVPVSRGEMRVIREILSFSVPRILGYDEMFAGPPNVTDASSSSFGGGPHGGSMMPPF